MTFHFLRTRSRAWFTRSAVLGVLVVLVCAALYTRYVVPVLQDGCGALCYSETYAAQEEVRTVALTFDDGPSGEATERILATLDEHDAVATFFLVGERIYEHPDLVRRIAAAGHTIGNHTFTSDEKHIHDSRERIQTELNKTNALIESLTGRSAVLYRPPSLVDLEPFEVVPQPGHKPVWDWVYEAGYVPVGVDIDSNDWRVTEGAAVVAQMREELRRAESGYYGMHTHVVLLHDLPHTADALPEILTMLRQEGYRVVPLNELIGVSEQRAMPPAGAALYHAAHRLILAGSGWMLGVLFVLALFLSVIGLARVAVFAGLKVRADRRVSPAHIALPFDGSVSVLIPAYNEEANIASTINSVLANTRIPDEILVIDDGSRDATTAMAEEIAAAHPGVVRVLTKHNGGKASALNLGLYAARGEVVVAIDGDTVLDARCIETLVAPFAERRVGAVAGKIVPANSSRLLEKYQVLEYMVGQNIDKEIVSALGSVHIVPGAVGAWRREAILEVGGYSTDTLVEDQDLTLALLGRGYGVVYVPEAVAYTEVPQSLRAFYLQRFRWTYGTFQCVWKYRHYLLGDSALRLGWISLPYAFVFNVLTPILALILTASFVLLAVLGLAHPSMWMFGVFLLADLVYAYVGVRNDPTVSTRMVPLVAIQRFVYLGVYLVIVALVVMKVLDGTPTRWNKLARIGAARQFFRAQNAAALSHSS